MSRSGVEEYEMRVSAIPSRGGGEAKCGVAGQGRWMRGGEIENDFEPNLRTKDNRFFLQIVILDVQLCTTTQVPK